MRLNYDCIYDNYRYSKNYDEIDVKKAKYVLGQIKWLIKKRKH